jgi:uncharacterized protein YfdQ (DUF2303 family)
LHSHGFNKRIFAMVEGLPKERVTRQLSGQSPGHPPFFATYHQWQTVFKQRFLDETLKELDISKFCNFINSFNSIMLIFIVKMFHLIVRN